MDYTQLASQQAVEKVMRALKTRNIEPHFVQNRSAALELVTTLIPAGGAVTNGSSTTLKDIGFIDLLKSGHHPWHNIKEAIVNEPNEAKRIQLRKQSSLADYWLGSIHALTEDGIAVIASASGSQLPAYAYTSQTVIWVVGAQKIVPTLADAMDRLRTYVYPREDQRMKAAGESGSTIGKILIFEKETEKRNLHLILVNEALGF